MIHPDTELRFIAPEIGYGVVALKLIPKGTITWAFDIFDQVFRPAQVAAMDKRHREIIDKYCYRDHDGNEILCWDNARFVNHSFHSSCISTAYNFELAVRDIHPGEELTDDYGYLNVAHPIDFLPEPDTTRIQVRPDDLLHFYKEWDLQLMDAFRQFNQVAQPLAWVIEEQYRDKVNAVVAGKAEMDSILGCYYDPTRHT
jgi:hypothetical protein